MGPWMLKWLRNNRRTGKWEWEWKWDLEWECELEEVVKVEMKDGVI